MIDVLIVDDSPTLRHLLRVTVESDPDMRVVGEAGDGRKAVELARKLRPTIISMDIQMPHMNGLDAIRAIMDEAPCPIVVVTGSRSEREVDVQRLALEAGALMVLRKPSGPPEQDPLGRELVRSLKVMSSVKVVRRRRRHKPDGWSGWGEPVEPSEHGSSLPPRILAIGASTGGPPAIQLVLAGLPPDIPPVLVVQHISSGFVKGMVRWLDETTSHRVKLAEDGERLERGTVYVAPDGVHLTVRRPDKVALLDEPPMDGHRPAVDRLFQSVAEIYAARGAGILLTGMGRDGARGLKLIWEKGGHTLAQNRETCVVFGMPGEAVALGAASVIAPLPEISGHVLDWMGAGNDSEVT